MWPFSRKEKDAEESKISHQNKIVKVGSDMIRVPSIDFFGVFSESETQLYTVAWADSDQSQGIGGFREGGEGTYILLKNSQVLLTGSSQRPNDGKVADTGIFVINDWLFGEGLNGIFYVFNKSGEQLVNHRFEANLLNNGISSDGKYAVCQCANSDTDDGGVLAFFDLESRSLTWKASPISGWADSYSFDSINRHLYLEYRDKGKYRYDFEGNFIDRERWEKERVNYASAFELSFIAKEQLKDAGGNLSPDKARELLSLLNRALEKGIDKYPNEQALIYRTIGETYESIGNTSEAIKNYELALQLNPKVGVKRKIVALKKEKS